MTPQQLCLYIDYDAIGVPYLKPGNPDSHSYLDLKAEPDKITLLPERGNWPELDTLIPRVNSGSAFKTIGCGAWLKQSGLRTQFTSYLQVCFDEIALNENPINYYKLFHLFSDYLKEKIAPEGLAISFVVNRTDFNGSQPLHGWSAQIITNGEGLTADNARKIPNTGYFLLAEFLRGVEL